MRLSLARIERWVWYLFLATFAWQTRLILWQADRLFVEWRSISLYASDVLMLVLFGLALIGRIKITLQKSDWVLFGFIGVAGLSIVHTDQLTVSMYQWLRLVQLVLFFFYVRYWAKHRFNLDTSLLAVVIGALAQSGLALAQFFLQHDIGFRWMGETLLGTDVTGVAVFLDSAGQRIMRAYGTLPHPNVLAAYLLAALWALGYLYLRHNHDELKHLRWVWAAAGTLMLWALYATFSRTMIAVGFVATLAMGIAVAGHYPPQPPPRRHPLLTLGVWWLVASAIFAGLFWRQIIARATISSHEEAVTLRVYYAKEAVKANWTGVGIGNFVTWLEKTDPGHPTWWYQPAHNLYLLIYSETGLLGIGLFLAWLIMLLRSARRGLLILLGCWLVIALFDHFFWTLQQGRILFWLIAALAVI